MRTHGIAVSTDEVLITAGAQQALDLALRALTRPGDRGLVEMSHDVPHMHKHIQS